MEIWAEVVVLQLQFTFSDCRAAKSPSHKGHPLRQCGSTEARLAAKARFAINFNDYVLDGIQSRSIVRQT
jgi:hypothetical protein